MDYRQFDNLTRSLARGASRRIVVQGLAAGAVASLVGFGAARPARGQELVPLGGRCSALGANGDCSQAGGEVICSDNGVTGDGDFNCCRNAGGGCTADFHCCGAALCVGNVCGGSTSGGSSSNGSLGASCTSTTQCSQSGGPVVCASNGLGGAGAKNCCRNTGGGCSSDAHCCLGLYCVNGACGGSASGAGIALGAPCTSSDQCSQTGGETVCADNGYAADGALNCCRNQGGACTGDAGCCYGYYCINSVCTTQGGGSGTLALGAECSTTQQCSQDGGSVVCADNGIATDGALNCCRQSGGACPSDAACCFGLYCVSGSCTSSTASGTLELGAACSADAQCSQDGGPVACADNGLAADGALNCCRYQGGTCFSTGGCCAGLDCIGGQCTPVNAQGGDLPLGAACSVADQCSQAGGPVACADNGLTTDGDLNCCRYAGGACASDPGCCAGLTCQSGVCQ
ncbi:MAG TPA: hypothetical protein VFU81_19140 [Thermomicrobiales bacterium]|nr:hypothetical protein [Thermomicrobiales bacterium]